VIDRIDPIRDDIAKLRHSMEQGFARLEGKIDTAVAVSAKEQTRFFFVAWAALLAAVIGLYGR